MTLELVPPVDRPTAPDGGPAIPGYHPYRYPDLPQCEEEIRAREEAEAKRPRRKIPPPPPFEDYFYTNSQLKDRGWTRALRLRFLGRVDHRLPVNHFRNYYGKDAYFRRRVRLAEVSPEFEAAFRQSAKRRKLPPDFVVQVLARIQDFRVNGVDEPLTAAQFYWARIDGVAFASAAHLAEARAHGLRTPHGC